MWVGRFLKACLLVCLFFASSGIAEKNKKDFNFYNLLDIKKDADEEEIQLAITIFVEDQANKVDRGETPLGSLSPEEQETTFTAMLLDPRARKLYDEYSALLRSRNSTRQKWADLRLFHDFKAGTTQQEWERLMQGRSYFAALAVADNLFTAFFGQDWEKRVDGPVRRFLRALEYFYSKSYRGEPLYREKVMHNLFGVDHGSLGHRLKRGCGYLLAAGVAGAVVYTYTTVNQNAQIESAVERRIAAMERPGDRLSDEINQKEQQFRENEKKQIQADRDKAFAELKAKRRAATPPATP